jgi:phasin family protein
MNENPIAAERAPTTTGAGTLYETAVKPTLSINPTNTVTQGLNTVIKSTQGFVAFGKANFEAATESGRILAVGVQDLTKHLVSTATASYEDAVATAKALGAAKSVKEAIDLQGAHAKTSISKAVSEAKNLADASVKLTVQAMAPLTARVAVAVETLAKAA